MNTHPLDHFDVIVIGGGHAGIEAAHAAAKLGSRTLLLTMNVDTIGLMSCNPSIGGIGKGHIVYEVAALGGLMPQLCTQTYLQARMLNTSKGPAVQGLRLQIDKYRYNRASIQALEATPNLLLRMGMAEEITVDSNQAVTGVRLRDGSYFSTRAIVVTTGTFLKGQIHIGCPTHTAGRQGEEAAMHLSDSLRSLGLQVGRLKTGTPPRILRSSIDFTQLTYQAPDELTYLFEFYPHTVSNTHPCYIAHTNETTHEIIRTNRHRSAMYNGSIASTGPRYCPSIEDKIGRFPDKSSHHVFVEPESAVSEEVYPNGVSTSLPFDVQVAFIRTIKGFERAHITRPAYAIEYDFVFPNQLQHSLQTKAVQGLFLAGQINGTTGYEEAAGQGIVAGINAHLQVAGKDPFIIDRTQGYIGIMIDDLITLGVDEPYRMFTSRAEHRLTLRQDNVFLRLMPKAYELGMIDESLYRDFCAEKDAVEQAIAVMRLRKDKEAILGLLKDIRTNRAAIDALLQRQLSDRALVTVFAELLYEPYLEREARDIARVESYQSLRLSPAINYRGMPGLSRELQDKLERYQPATVAAAALIPGMTPAALSLLILKTRDC